MQPSDRRDFIIILLLARSIRMALVLKNLIKLAAFQYNTAVQYTQREKWRK